MVATEQTKICKLCAETIRAAAKVCPHCHTCQKHWLFATRFDLFAILTLAIFAGTIFLLVRLFAEGRSFSSSREQIEIVSSQLAIEATEYSTNLVVVGVLTNSSPYTWEIDRFEVRYFNQDGKMIDTDAPSGYFTVLPHSDHSFRLSVYSRKSIPEHASRKVYVSSARDPKAW